jgi:hypothetical protein
MSLALACTPAPPSTNAPVETALSVPSLTPSDAGATPNGVRFGRVPLRVGARWSVSTRAESRNEEAAQVSRYESDYTVEVLAVEAGAPSRIRLHFDRNVDVFQSSERPTVVQGKTYVLDAEAPHVRDATAAGAASEVETERVLDVFPDLGTRSRIDEVLPEDAMAIGEARDDLAAAILRMIHPRAWQLISGKATLARVDGAEAVFAVSLVAESRGSGLRLDLTGEARVTVRHARLAMLTLDGHYEGDQVKGSFDLRRVVRDE